MNKEIVLQNKIRIALNKYGISMRLNTGVFYTTTGSMIRTGLVGIPDLVLIQPGGRVTWLEVKTKKGRLSANQKRMHDRLRSMGHKVAVVRSVEEAVKVVKEE